MSEGNGIVDTMEDKVVFEVTRSDVTTIVGRDLTDKEWQAMSIEISDFLDYYTEQEVPRLFADIDSLVSEISTT